MQLTLSVYSGGKTMHIQTCGKGWLGWCPSHVLASEPHHVVLFYLQGCQIVALCFNVSYFFCFFFFFISPCCLSILFKWNLVRDCLPGLSIQGSISSPRILKHFPIEPRWSGGSLTFTSCSALICANATDVIPTRTINDRSVETPPYFRHACQIHATGMGS